MSTSDTQTMSPEEQAAFSAMTERMRQLRRRRGVPNGVSLADAVALHILNADEVEAARWGDAQPLTPQHLPANPATFVQAFDHGDRASPMP